MFNWIKRLFSKSAIVPTPATSSVGSVTVPSAASSTPDIILGSITGASLSEIEMIKQALGYVKAVVYSPAFHTAVLAASFTTVDGLTNEQIYKAFTTQRIIVNIDDYTGSWRANNMSHTMGYENGDGYVHMNRVFVHDALVMGSLILHEVAHMLGFRHLSASESTSIPYTMNQIFDTITSQQMSLGIS